MGILKKRNKLTVTKAKNEEEPRVHLRGLEDNDYDLGDDKIELPTAIVNANLSDKEILHKSDKKIDESLQTSINIIKAHPELYGKIRRLNARRIRKFTPERMLSKEQINKEIGEEESDKIVGQTNPIFRPLGGVSYEVIYNKGNPYNNTQSLSGTRVHEFNHVLYDKYLQNAQNNNEWQNVLTEAYDPNGMTNSEDFHGYPNYMEQAATNAELRNYLKENGIDYNKYDFVSFTGDDVNVNLPGINGYMNQIIPSIEAYVSYWRNKLIKENGEKYRGEIEQKLTDYINSKIRKALSTIAYRETPNNEFTLYARGGGLLLKNRLLPRRRFNNF